ncbi:hypothetical protein [Bradyrhizobium paxllaeri]|nr:hypothetical protein [Bradyrhizobium paxllaeri]
MIYDRKPPGVLRTDEEKWVDMWLICFVDIDPGATWIIRGKTVSRVGALF